MMVEKIITISAEFLLLLNMTYVSSRKHGVGTHWNEHSNTFFSERTKILPGFD